MAKIKCGAWDLYTNYRNGRKPTKHAFRACIGARRDLALVVEGRDKKFTATVKSVFPKKTTLRKKANLPSRAAAQRAAVALLKSI